MKELSRRSFLGASALVLCAPTRLFAKDVDSDVVLRFAALSDVHFDKSHNDTSNERVRLNAALEFMNAFVKDQPYDQFDALVVAGDFSNHGLREELEPFRRILDARLESSTKRVLCMGNHEYYGGNRALWEEIFETDANRRQEINGYQFITISPEKGTCSENDYLYLKEWLDKEIQAAIALDPTKPVFVVQHYHVYRTVFGSYNLPGDFTAGVHDLIETLSKYPQVVHISGHSHYPSVEPRSIWQGAFTCVGTGSLSYFALHTFEKERGFRAADNVDIRAAGTFLIWDVYRDNTIRIRLYDTISQSFLEREYLIVDPLNVEKYVYTDRRYDLAQPARWSAQAKAEALEVLPQGAAIRFSQGIDDACVISYRVLVEALRDGEWQEEFVRYLWSDFFMKKPVDMIEYDLLNLIPGTKYRLKIYACGAFQKETTDPLVLELETPSLNAVDQTAERPQADLLDVAFDYDAQKPRVAPENFSARTKGTPQAKAPAIIRDAELGDVASFNGIDQAIILPFRPLKVAAVTNQVSIGVRFRIDGAKVRNERSSIFGSTESGGLGFEYDPDKKILFARCWIDGKYCDLSAPIERDQIIDAHITYDGQEMRLYVDGRLVANAEREGAFRFTQSESARAFCVGGDVNPGLTARWFFPGVIAFARAYSWALTRTHVAALSVK